MNVFITGATGYIGSVVAEHLQREGYAVTALARSETSAERLEARGYQVRRGGLADASVLREGARDADAVMHIAAGGEEQEALDRAAVNALLEGLAGSGKPFIYTSGVWVLGDTGDEPADEDASLDPAALVTWRPAVEQRVLEATGDGVRSVVLRPALVYGHGGGIPAMLVDGGRDEGVVRYVGDGQQRWPFVHVEDLADLYVRALDAPAGTLLHASNGPSVRLHDVAEAAAQAAGVPGHTEPWPLEDARAELGGFADALALDQVVSGERARRLLGWTPSRAGILEDLRKGSYAASDRPRPYVCATCGTQFSASEQPPDRCPICEDERQYVGPKGQRWTTLADLRGTHRNTVRTVEPGLTEIFTEPTFAIGQRTLLIETPDGNVLWDCITLLDDDTIAAVQARGGIDAIAISHPHYYSTAVEWSRAFGDAPVYLHAADRQWVMRPDPAIVHWDEETMDLGGGLTLIRTGGHFEGSAVLHWPDGAGGRGALFTGDTIKVAMDRRYVSFMYSFPNHVPLPPDAVEHIAASVAPFDFDRIYGAWTGHTVRTDAKAAVRRSVDRYRDAVGS